MFLAWHVPLMFRTTAGMDEDLFAVPGTTILRTGVPQIPYLPVRDRRLFYFGADVALYVLPPLSFYLQALVQAVLGDGLGPARFASTIEGLIATWLVFDLGRRWLGDRRAAFWAALLYLFGRAAFFPATTARPDMAAAMFGLLATWAVDRDAGPTSARRAAWAGIAGGLSLLCHPFGIVPCAQNGLRVLAGPAPAGGRLKGAAAFGLAALAAFGLWGILIARHPDLFRIQFHGNVLGRANAGLAGTLLNPWPVLAFQARQLVSRALPVQSALYAFGASWALARVARTGSGWKLAYHLAASTLLLTLFMGRHPMLTYFAYPAAFACIAAGGAASRLTDWGARKWGRPRTLELAMTGLLIASLVPGSGFKALSAHLRHRDDPSYNARRLAETIMADLDPEALVAVDGEFVLDFYLAGRRVVDAHYLEFLPVPYDYLVAGPDGLAFAKVPREELEWIRRYGDPDDEFAPATDLYRPARPRPAGEAGGVPLDPPGDSGKPGSGLGSASPSRNR